MEQQHLCELFYSFVAVFAATNMPKALRLSGNQPVPLLNRVAQYLFDLPPSKIGIERAKLTLFCLSWTSTTQLCPY
jgi:hypothetical protein